MFYNEKEHGVDGMKLFEVECECDDTWSASGIYSFDVYANREINLEEAREIINANGNNGLGDVIRIIDQTNETNYDGANFTYVEGLNLNLKN